MKRLLLAGTIAAAAVLATAAPAGATNECNGLQVCVPVAGPWVLAASTDETQWQLSCPRNFVVGGLDAELTSRAIDVVFRATLGSPVNPGISTSTAAVFLGRLVLGSDPAASFRPHIGCIPTSGGGQRVPTAHHAFPPGKPTVRRVTTVAARAGALRTVTRACNAGERLVSATHAVGFRTTAPPTRAQALAVSVSQSAADGRVTLGVRGGQALRDVPAVVQLDLVCVGVS